MGEYRQSFDKWIVKCCKKLGQRTTVGYNDFSGFLKYLGFSISDGELDMLLTALNLDRERLGYAEAVRVIGRYVMFTK